MERPRFYEPDSGGRSPETKKLTLATVQDSGWFLEVPTAGNEDFFRSDTPRYAG